MCPAGPEARPRRDVGQRPERPPGCRRDGNEPPEGIRRRGIPTPRTVFGPTCDSVDRLPGELALPADLAGSLAAFEASAFCRDSFGAAFHSHYAASRRNELEAFATWQSQRITEFEWQRYFGC